MLVVLIALFSLIVLLFAAVLLMQRHVIDRLDTMAHAVIALQRQAPESPVSRLTAGRSVPTLDELSQARNRMDLSGVAHAGGSSVADPDRPTS